MSKELSRDHSDAGKPLPHCKALLFCEKVTEIQITEKITLHNLIEKFAVPGFPGRSTRFTVFLQVYDGIGRYSLAVEFMDLADGSTIAGAKLDDLDFPDRLTKIQVMVPFDFVRLSRPGRYEVVVLVDGEPLARQHFDAEVDDGGV
jgi:hypothetical protein